MITTAAILFHRLNHLLACVRAILRFVAEAKYLQTTLQANSYRRTEADM